MYQGRAIRWVCAIAAVLAGLAVTGCRLDEQDRETRFEKGTYLGKPDQQLTDTQVDKLRARARHQQD